MPGFFQCSQKSDKERQSTREKYYDIMGMRISLFDIMSERDMNVAMISKEIGIDPHTVHSYLREERVPGFRSLSKIKKWVDKHNQIMGEDSNEKTIQS